MSNTSWREKVKDTVHDENNIKGFFGDYRWLSNFEPCLVEYEGTVYQSSEAAYQAAKCAIPQERSLFINRAASECKKLGRKVKLRPDWDEVKLQIMGEVLLSKFTKNNHLRLRLIETGNKYLEETNWWNDRFWGVCRGIGDNNLGKILMDVREKLEVF